MPFALLFIGLVFLIASVRGTTDGPDGLYALINGDFTGQDNFVYWIVAIILIGSIGYIPKVKPFSVAFLALVIIVMFVAKGKTGSVAGGFFEKFTAALDTTSKSAATTTASNVGGFQLPDLSKIFA